MALLDIAGGFVLGFLVGVGAALFYLRWKMRRQLGNLEEQMQGLMDMSGEMEEALAVEEPGESLEEDGE